jgi:hypothetical protein
MQTKKTLIVGCAALCCYTFLKDVDKNNYVLKMGAYWG